MPHRVVSHEDWLTARKALLAREKEFTKARDALSAARRELPWEKLAKSYIFDTTQGPRSLSDLFAGRSQLMIYHFMLGPGWVAGCPSCSYLADHFDGAVPHLAQRDVTFIAVSSAPLAEIEAYKKRMGWHFTWVSSNGTSFNHDFGVSASKDELARGEAVYNYAKGNPAAGDERPGLSAFIMDDGAVYHTYSTYGRGLDIIVGTYNMLDLAPKGRDEDALPWPMAWVKRHDEYEQAKAAACCH